MSGEIIKSFLVGLGFKVDDGDLAKFNKAINNAGVKIAALYGSINLLAGGIVKSISSISEGFEQMGYEYHLIAPAINKALVLRREMLKAYAAAGINISKVVANSIRLNMSLTKTKFALEAIYKSVGSRFFTLLTRQSDIFRNNLYKFMPKIQAGLEKFVTFIFRAFDAVTTLGLRLWSILTRVYDFFIQLDKATDGWSSIILGVVAAWKLLNLSFLTTPLGIILSLAVAILALYDDFKTFKEGGQSLINWGSDFTKMIVGMIGILTGAVLAIKAVSIAFKAWEAIEALILLIKNLNTAWAIFAVISNLAAAPIWVIVAAVGALLAALTLLDAKWKIFGGNLSGFFSGIGGKIMDFAGGGTPSAPLGSNAQNSQTNQNVRQQTNINVTGGADANAIGQAVGGQQARVNQDMVRNLKGATR